MNDDEKQIKPALKIERANITHAELLAALHATCFKDPWSSKAFASLLTTPGTIAWIASYLPGPLLSHSQSEKPAGFLVVRQVADEAEILSIGVLPEARGRAVGVELMKMADQLDGLKTLYLDVAEDNDPALRLYRRRGFEIVGRRSGYYAREAGVKVDSLTMRAATSGDSGDKDRYRE